MMRECPIASAHRTSSLLASQVHGIHNLAWAGTPAEGAAWLRVQPLATTWHRILLIPVMGGIVVGMLHAVTLILEQHNASLSSSTAATGSYQPVQQANGMGTTAHAAGASANASSSGSTNGNGGIDWSVASKPVIRAVSAAVTLGTGSSLGPEGPSVDIGKAWADGMAEILMNTRERKMALVAAGAAAGISSGERERG